MQITQGLNRSAALFGNRLSTVFGDRKLTWRETRDRVARLAGGLIASGAKPGDRIAILGLNSDRYVEAYYAIFWAGCIAVPFNSRWAPAEIQHALTDCEPSMVLVDGAFLRAISEVAEDGLTVIMMDPGVAAPELASFDSLIEASEPIDDRSGHGDQLAAIFYTGGTTGRSKGVMLSHANLISNFLAIQSVAPYEDETVFLHTPPMFHLADAGCLFGLTLLGGTHVILPGFEVKATVEAVQTHGVTALVLVPTMIGMLCEEVRQSGADLGSVRRLTYGASSISERVLAEAMKILPNAEFAQAYGQTELSPCVTALTHADHLRGNLRAAGRPIPTVDVRIVDENMQDVPTGSVGEVAVRGPGTMLGYWNLLEVTAETLIDGWLRTGDAGHLDAEGYLYLVDRVKDMIVSGGENVYSAEVENALLRHPGILQCAVIGIPHPRWGEAVHAVVCLREGAAVTDEELIAHCRPLIANYKIPKSFDLGFEPLPLSGVGKVLKTDLRKPYWAGQERAIS